MNTNEMFEEVPIDFGTIVFPTAQHAYEAAKSESHHEWLFISKLATPLSAKYYGEHCLIVRPDWDKIKDSVLQEILRVKGENRSGHSNRTDST